MKSVLMVYVKMTSIMVAQKLETAKSKLPRESKQLKRYENVDKI